MQNTVEKGVVPNVTHNSNKETYRSFLKGLHLFSDFPDDSIALVLKNSIFKEYKKDSLLFMTGDKADFFNIIINGWIKLYRNTRGGHESVIAALTNGEIFGKSAILKNGQHKYTAEAVSDLLVLQIPASFIQQMKEDHQHFDDFVSKLLESELNEINQLHLETEHLSKMTSAERVACFLLKLCKGQDKQNMVLHLPFEKSLAAGRLGMTPETFSRSLNQLKPLGVETQNSTVIINNFEQLKAKICERCSATKLECFWGDEIEND